MSLGLGGGSKGGSGNIAQGSVLGRAVDAGTGPAVALTAAQQRAAAGLAGAVMTTGETLQVGSYTTIHGWGGSEFGGTVKAQRLLWTDNGGGSFTRAERDAAVASLVEHQAISDRLVVAARSALEANDVNAIQQILHAASLFGASRESARLDAEAAALEIKLAEIAARKAALA